MDAEILKPLFFEAQKIINVHHMDSSEFFSQCCFEIGFYQETDEAFGFCDGTFPDYVIGIHQLFSEPTQEDLKFITMTFVHEFLHILHADWQENQVRAEEYKLANLAEYGDTLLRRDHAYLPRRRSLKKAIERSDLARGITSEPKTNTTIMICGDTYDEQEEDVESNLIWARYMEKRYDYALRLADKRLKKHDDGRTMYYKGRIYFEQGKLSDALFWINKAIEKIPNDPYPIYYKALILMTSGNIKEAKYFFDGAAEKNSQEGENNDDLTRHIAFYKEKLSGL